MSRGSRRGPSRRTHRFLPLIENLEPSDGCCTDFLSALWKSHLRIRSLRRHPAERGHSSASRAIWSGSGVYRLPGGVSLLEVPGYTPHGAGTASPRRVARSVPRQGQVEVFITPGWPSETFTSTRSSPGALSGLQPRNQTMTTEDRRLPSLNACRCNRPRHPPTRTSAEVRRP